MRNADSLEKIEKDTLVVALYKYFLTLSFTIFIPYTIYYGNNRKEQQVTIIDVCYPSTQKVYKLTFSIQCLLHYSFNSLKRKILNINRNLLIESYTLLM